MSWRNSPEMLACQASPTCSSAGLVDIGTRADHAIRDSAATARAIALGISPGDLVWPAEIHGETPRRRR